MSEVDQWSLLKGEQDMEVLEHVLRCILHLGDTNTRADDFLACTKVQNPDGGWSKQSHTDQTSMWITTFVALKLCRGNLILKYPKIEESIQRALAFVLSSQEQDVASGQGDRHPARIGGGKYPLGTPSPPTIGRNAIELRSRSRLGIERGGNPCARDRQARRILIRQITKNRRWPDRDRQHLRFRTQTFDFQTCGCTTTTQTDQSTRQVPPRCPLLIPVHASSSTESNLCRALPAATGYPVYQPRLSSPVFTTHPGNQRVQPFYCGVAVR